jgi:hypothetical protein
MRVVLEVGWLRMKKRKRPLKSELRVRIESEKKSGVPWEKRRDC